MNKMDIEKKVLDATCGSRMIWFDKNNPIAIYCDKRELENETIWTSKDERQTRYLTIKPDVLADFTNLPFDDETFYLVVFDPPHLFHIGDNAWMCKKYGRLDENWQDTIKKGFDECMRVLKPNGTLIFKWNETQISVNEIIKTIQHKPLFGNRSGKQLKTHWMCFLKEN